MSLPLQGALIRILSVNLIIDRFLNGRLHIERLFSLIACWMTEEYLYESEHTGNAQNIRTDKEEEFVFFGYFFFLRKEKNLALQLNYM